MSYTIKNYLFIISIGDKLGKLGKLGSSKLQFLVSYK